MRYLLLSCLASTPLVSAQTPAAVLRVGDPVPDGSHMTATSLVQIESDGSWVGLVDSDGADLSQDGFLLREGQVLLREGASLLAPAGGTIDEIESVHSGESGDFASVLKVRPSPSLPSIEGVYFNDRLVVLKDDLVGGPLVPATAYWDRFDGAWFDGARTLLVLGEIVNPVVAGAREDTLARFHLDADGAVESREVLLTKGQFLPVVGEFVSSIDTSFTFALDRRGDHVVCVTTGGGARVLLENGQRVLAREGEASPILGRNYRTLALSRVGLNDFGQHAFSASLAGDVDNACIVKDGQKFVQSGDVLPFLSAPLANPSLAPVQLANSGDLFWYANDTLGTSAFVRNMDVIVQENSTTIGGVLVTGVEGDADAFDTSPDGRFWIGRVELQGIGDAIVTADFGLVVPVPGCAGNTAELAKADGDARVGQRLTLGLDGAQSFGAQSALLIGTSAARPGSPCGLATAGGELLIAPTSLLTAMVGAPWNGSPVAFDLDIPANVALVDLELFVQGAFVDTGGSARRLVLSNGLRLEIGAP
jgi:hypothetical protein